MAFQNAHHFVIDTFNAHNYSTVVHLPPSSDPLSTLHAARAVEATHTSKTASYAPKCKPGTRVKVTQDIVDWAVAVSVAASINPQARSTSILWFQGPAGAGKTCIMREVASRLNKMGLLGATYFFSNRVEGLSAESPFVATVAHQLLNTIPGVRPLILRAIEDNLNIFGESIETQMEELILKPLTEVSPPGAVLLVDGFDECAIAERGHLLQVLHTLSTSTPFLFIIIASRPELDLRTAFSEHHFKAITHEVRLQDYDGNSDIRDYLCDEFCRIREWHPARKSIPESWPAEEVLETLVRKSSGNFIVSSTVMKYVDNPRRNPVVLLQEVMALFNSNSTPSDPNPLAPLDALYTMILHPAEGNYALMKRILHCIMGIKTSRVLLLTAFLDELLFLEAGTTDMTLCDLHSIVSVPSKNHISFHHASLCDFLTSRHRSLDLYQSNSETHLDIATLCADHLTRWSLQCEMDPEHSSTSIEYAGAEWLDHFSLGVSHGHDSVKVPIPGALPHTLVQFDARLFWKYRFVETFKNGDTFNPPSVHATIQHLEPLRFDSECQLAQSLFRMHCVESRVWGRVVAGSAKSQMSNRRGRRGRENCEPLIMNPGSRIQNDTPPCAIWNATSAFEDLLSGLYCDEEVALTRKELREARRIQNVMGYKDRKSLVRRRPAARADVQAFIKRRGWEELQAGGSLARYSGWERS
ncbi:hypothetical protein NMY22_g9244 [Coprinellus aureogranulatus]|nr:hypothetical protein NMY22_g9244 [Coprinellus aureogranulatus]